MTTNRPGNEGNNREDMQKLQPRTRARTEVLTLSGTGHSLIFADVEFLELSRGVASDRGTSDRNTPIPDTLLYSVGFAHAWYASRG